MGQRPSLQDWHLEGRSLLRDDSADTAKVLRARCVFFDPHDGHGTSSSDMVRSSFSNRVLHELQVYS